MELLRRMFRWEPMPRAVGVVAVAYITVDYLREVNEELHAKLQPVLWGFLALALAWRGCSYPLWRREIQSLGVFLGSLGFMLAALSVEACFVQFVTTVLGLDWHWAAQPLPDTGQWLLLYLNDVLPSWVVTILRAPLVGLHHYLILFLLLAFSAIYGSVKSPGMGLGARYMFSMALGRLVRILTFASTIVPSARPWCAHHRIRTASYPHPWAQKYYIPYASNPDMVRKLLRTDEAFAAAGEYPAEYVPNWGSMQFLVNILRPPDPALYPQFAGQSWFSTLRRAGGGCNDLIFSGHILVSVLTAMAWTEAYPGWTAGLMWVLVLHSAQREIRERHHYSVDVVAGLFVGVMLWWVTGFIWSKHDDFKVRRGKMLIKKEDAFIKAAKDGDMEKVRQILSEVEKAGHEPPHRGISEYASAAVILMLLFGLVLLVFNWTDNG